jgi:hypothetical protein
MGFTLPFEKWMQKTGWLRDEIESVSCNGNQPFNSDVVREVWRKFLAKPRAIGWTRPWSLYVLAKWCEINRVTPQ